MGCNFCTTSEFFGGKGKVVNFFDSGRELFDVIELTVTINDPQVYEKPWESRTRLPLKRLPDNGGEPEY